MALKDIPSSDDFFMMGIEHLMIGYDGILKFLLHLSDYNDGEGNPFHEERDNLQNINNFWNNARLNLLVHAGLIHEGIDFILKAKLTKVSPYLLIKNDPAEVKNKEFFSDLLTHDSKSLPALVNTYCNDPLDPRFLTLFEKGRQRRNKIRHTYDRTLQVQAEELIKEVFQLMSFLTKDKWMKLRTDYYDKEAIMSLYSDSDIDQVRPALLNEFKVLNNILSPSEFSIVFQATKKQRFFLCYQCTHPDYTDEIRTCVLVEKKEFKRRYLSCLLCRKLWSTQKRKCNQEDCECDMMVTEVGKCAYCAEYDFQR